MENPSEKADILAARSLDLASSNVRHLLKIEETETSRDEVTAALCAIMAQARRGDPSQFCDMLAITAQTIHASAQHYIGDAKRTYTYNGQQRYRMDSECLMSAAHTQDRLIRTIEAWRKLQRMEDKKPAQNAKQTRQNAPLDA